MNDCDEVVQLNVKIITLNIGTKCKIFLTKKGPKLFGYFPKMCSWLANCNTCSFTVYLGFGHLIPLSIFAILILVHAYLAVIPFKPATSVASPGVINGF